MFRNHKEGFIDRGISRGTGHVLWLLPLFFRVLFLSFIFHVLLSPVDVPPVIPISLGRRSLSAVRCSRTSRPSAVSRVAQRTFLIPSGMMTRTCTFPPTSGSPRRRYLSLTDSTLRQACRAISKSRTSIGLLGSYGSLCSWATSLYRCRNTIGMERKLALNAPCSSLPPCPENSGPSHSLGWNPLEDSSR